MANLLWQKVEVKKVLITGPDGFVGKNLRLALSSRSDIAVIFFNRDDNVSELPSLLVGVDFIFHLAGVNRPNDPAEFTSGNADLTRLLAAAVVLAAKKSTKPPAPIVFTSSVQANQAHPYGTSKRQAENHLRAVSENDEVPVHLFRLPNVFGKWGKPNYNSAVSTFCHNITRNLPIQVNDPQAAITLVYIDDVIERFIALMDGAATETDLDGFENITPQYTTTVGALAETIVSFKHSRETLVTERVGTGLVRALYSTYVSYLPPADFAYPLVKHEDPRGMFVEMLKTPDAGQFSFFTAHPGITRGGHYHHTKTEKFLVIKGEARFKFRHMLTDERHELTTSGTAPQVVETVPGWTHDITNIGSEEMIVMLWANEIFDRARPDTFTSPL